MDNRLRSTAEVAGWLGVTVGTFQRWAKEGIVKPALRLPGGEYRWDLADIRDQLRSDRPISPRNRPKDEPVPDTPNRPAVITAIVTSDRGVLIGQRHDGKPPWTFIAGEQEPGESPEDTIIREVKEETGLEIVPGHVLGERVHPKTDRHMIYISARPAIDSVEVTVGDPDELAQVRWAGLAEAVELLPGMFEPVREHLDQAIK
jgi:8-oxo-dGTP pyrophosphatase MutT (NUDIX family)